MYYCRYHTALLYYCRYHTILVYYCRYHTTPLYYCRYHTTLLYYCRYHTTLLYYCTTVRIVLPVYVGQWMHHEVGALLIHDGMASRDVLLEPSRQRAVVVYHTEPYHTIP